MVKAFTDQEKEWIQQQLVEKGRELFGQYGLKKTSIKELTDAVGIAQGSFYNFFGSKEELYFEILQLEEEVIRGRLMAEHFPSDGKITPQALKGLIRAGFEVIETHPIIRRIYVEDEYQRMIRKLPQEKLEEHLANDTDLLVPLIRQWQQAGWVIEQRPEVIASSLRALIMLSLHKKEIGEEIYDETIQLLIDLFVDGLMV